MEGSQGVAGLWRGDLAWPRGWHSLPPSPHRLPPLFCFLALCFQGQVGSGFVTSGP